MLGFLTGSLPAQQVLALRLVWVDGSDRHIIRGVRLQELQHCGGVVSIQDVLRNRRGQMDDQTCTAECQSSEQAHFKLRCLLVGSPARLAFSTQCGTEQHQGLHVPSGP